MPIPLSADLLLNNLFPLLALSDLYSLAMAVPELIPLLDQWKQWGRLMKDRKMMKFEPKIGFLEYYDKIQSVYIWGFINAKTSLTWITAAPSRDDAIFERGPLRFRFTSREGIVQSTHGIDLMRPLRLDFDVDLYVERAGHGVFLCSNGNLYTRIPGFSLAPTPVLRNISPKGFYRSQWATHVTDATGKIWNFLPIDDVLGNTVQYFSFPFSGKPLGITLQRNCYFALVEDMGIISVPHDYSGGDNYTLMCPVDSFPEKVISMVGYFRGRTLGENPDEAEAEYNEVAVLLGESGRLWYFGPKRYCSESRAGLITCLEWKERYPELDWNGGYCVFQLEAELHPQLQRLQNSRYPRIKSICPWSYSYGIGLYADDSTVMYLNPHQPPTNPPFVHQFTVETFGINAIGYDGRIYRLPLSMSEWHQVARAQNVVDVFSLQSNHQGALLDSTTTFVRTEKGELYQLGLIQGATALQQATYREVPPSYMPNSPRISQVMNGAGINPRRREFLNPFVAVPKLVPLPGRVIDMYSIFQEGMTFCALVKDD